MRLYLPAAFAAAAIAASSPAAATVILGTGAGVVQPDENVLFNDNPSPGAMVFGVTNQTDTSVSIFGGETLVGSGGQARIGGQDGLTNTSFAFQGLAGQTLGFDLTDPNYAFTQAEFRIFVGGGTATSATLTFFDTDGQQFQQAFAIPSNGFFYANAIDGQTIDRFSIATNGSFQDLRQVRIGGVVNLADGVGPIPEPGAWALMILGFGGAGGMLRRRRAAIA